MHEKYFVSLAAEIYQIPDKSVRQHAARAVARACIQVNPRFNMQLFLTACDAVWPSAPKAFQQQGQTTPPSTPVEVKTLSEFMAEQEALHPGIHDKVQAAADELRASLAQQPMQKGGGEDAPPSAPVGVEGLPEKWRREAPRARVDVGEDAALAWREAAYWCAFQLEAALAQQPAAVDAVHELRLCESSRLHLFPDRLYRFTVDPDCSLCAEELSHCALPAQQPTTVDGAARRRDVRLWMRHNAGNYSTATELAEAADRVFRLPDGGLNNETHWVWDEAAEAVDDSQRGCLA